MRLCSMFNTILYLFKCLYLYLLCTLYFVPLYLVIKNSNLFPCSMSKKIYNNTQYVITVTYFFRHSFVKRECVI